MSDTPVKQRGERCDQGTCMESGVHDTISPKPLKTKPKVCIIRITSINFHSVLNARVCRCNFMIWKVTTGQDSFFRAHLEQEKSPGSVFIFTIHLTYLWVWRDASNIKITLGSLKIEFPLSKGEGKMASSESDDDGDMPSSVRASFFA